MMFLLSVALCLLSLAIAHRAPDEAPDLPEGWCLRPGKATKTTGECICVNSVCRGPKCRNESGFIYYAYADCPTCQCVSKDGTNQPVKAERPIVHVAPVDGKIEEDDEEIPYSWTDYIFDNYDIWIGVVAAVFILVVGVVFLLQILGFVVDNSAEFAGEKPTSKVGPIELPSKASKDSKAE